MLSIRVKKDFLNKESCINEARRILSEGLIRNMSELQLAREIYFHALAFHFCERTGMFRMVKKHADPIDLADGGDRLFMKIIFAASWFFSKKG